MKAAAKKVIRKKRPEIVKDRPGDGLPQVTPEPQLVTTESILAPPSADELAELWVPAWVASSITIASVKVHPREDLRNGAAVTPPRDILKSNIITKTPPVANWREYLGDIDSRKELVSFEFLREFAAAVSASVEQTRKIAYIQWRALFGPTMLGHIGRYIQWQAQKVAMEEIAARPIVEQIKSGLMDSKPRVEPKPIRSPGIAIEKILNDLAGAVALCERFQRYPPFAKFDKPFPLPTTLSQRLMGTVKLVQDELALAQSLLDQLVTRREFDEVLTLGKVKGRVLSPESIDQAFYALGSAAWMKAKASGPNAMIEPKSEADPRHKLWIEKAGTWADEFTDIEKVQKMRYLHNTLDRDRDRHKRLQDQEDKSASADKQVRWFAELLNIDNRIKKNERRLAQLEGK